MSRRIFNQKPGQVIATYTSFEDAMKDAARLRDHGFDAKSIQVVGRDLISIDYLGTRVTPLSQFISGVFSGVMSMILVMAIAALFSPSLLITLSSSPFGSIAIVGVVMAGALIIGAFRAALFAFRTRNSELPIRTVRSFSPQRFELCVTGHVAQARMVLGHRANAVGPRETPAAPAASAQVANLGEDAGRAGTGRPAQAEGQAAHTKAADDPQGTHTPETASEPKYGVRLPRNERGEVIRDKE